MKKWYKSKEILLLLLPGFLILLSQVLFPERMLDLHIHDTMYVISFLHIFEVMFFLMLAFLPIHLYLRRQQMQERLPASIHIFSSLTCIPIIWLTFYFQSEGLSEGLNPGRSMLAAPVHSIMLITLFIFVLVQVLFLVYFFVTVVKHWFISMTKK
jgi:hypothetical protein